MVVGDQDFSIGDLEDSVGGSEVLGGETLDISCRVSEAGEVELIDCAAGSTVIHCQ